MSENDRMREELLEYLKGFDAEPIREDEISIQHYADAQGLTHTQANKRLTRMVENGVLYKRRAMVDGVERNVYGKQS